MKKVFHKISSTLMAFLVLFTTMSFTVDMHYCGNSLVDFSFYQKADSCGMISDIDFKGQESQPCERAFTEKPCCSDHQIVKNANQDLKASFDKLTFGQHTFVATFFYTYINLFEGLDKKIVSFKDYHPPFLEQDVLVLNQVFLI